MSAPPTDESVSSSLLPTPSSEESTPTEEYVEEMREAGIQPHERLYLPGRKWHAQRTLSRVAPTLLPTPRAEERMQQNSRDDYMALSKAVTLLPTPTTSEATGRGEHGQGGDNLRETVAKLLPTPTTQPSTGNGHARNLGKEAKLLPTPTPTAQHSSGGRRPDGSKYTETSGVTLMDVVAGRTGEPTGPPSDGGSSSPAPHPGQLTIEDD
jgi:hypothetical protein